MNNTRLTLTLMVGFVMAGAPSARAQATPRGEPKLFVSVNAGGQLQTRTIGTSASSALYKETLTVTSSQTVGRGFVFDAGGGVRVWRRLGVGVGLSTFRGRGDAAVTAVIPHPQLFGRPATVTLTGTDMKQTDIAVNVQAVWMFPISDKLETSLIFGPSFIHVSQDMPSIAVPSGTQNATASTTRETATTAKAGNVGVDVSYRLTDAWLVGGIIRYLGGEVDLPSAPNLKVGGLQVLGGLRFRY